MSARIPRDPDYALPPRWPALYRRHFPHNTDACSRHVAIVAQSLRDTSSPLRRLLSEAGYEPDHMASSMEATVKMLWEIRSRPSPSGEGT